MQPADIRDSDLHDLEKLAAEMTARGYHTDIQTPPGRTPHLLIRNPHASALTERVYAQAGSYWFSWLEPIAGCDDVTATADIIARVLRAAD